VQIDPPTVERNVPGEQGVQVFASRAPGDGEKLPLGHGVHTSYIRYVPAGQISGAK